jgi:hypothetical protein
VGDDGEPVDRMDSDGAGLATLAFPGGAWSSCSDEEGALAMMMRCATDDGGAGERERPGGLAEYSVSLVDGFNVPVVTTPHEFQEGRRCPSSLG